MSERKRDLEVGKEDGETAKEREPQIHHTVGFSWFFFCACFPISCFIEQIL